jgi:hypothetical protein
MSIRQSSKQSTHAEMHSRNNITRPPRTTSVRVSPRLRQPCATQRATCQAILPSFINQSIHLNRTATTPSQRPSQPSSISELGIGHSLINPPHKRISRQEPHSPSEEPVNSARQEAVAEKEYGGNESLDMQTREVIPGAIEEGPEGAAAADEEGLPPPVVVLATR